MKLIIDNLTKSYGDRDLFRALCLEAGSGMRLAVIGPNGCGKSTLLQIVAGVRSADSGQVVMQKGSRIGYVAQELGASELETELLSWVLEVVPSWSELWREWEGVEGEQDALRLAHRQEELERRFGYNPEHRAKAILQGLGFAPERMGMRLGLLSGGWRERAKLARAMLGGGDILLLDEPTNHLDLEAILWLEEYLRSFQGILLFIAHDRYFLERISTHILSLSGERPVFRPGTLSDYMEWKLERETQQRKQAERIQEEIGRKRAFIDRFRYKATKASQAQSRVLQVEKLKKDLAALAPERQGRRLDFSFPEPERAGKVIASGVDLGFSFPDGTDLFHDVNFNVLNGQKIALVGSNGAGKSTLLKLIMGRLTPTSGRVSMGTTTRTGYFSQHQEELLQPEAFVLGEVRRFSHPHTTEEQLRSVLGLFLLSETYWDRRVKSLSGGEKNRLVLSTLFLRRANFLVLDEPTNHLDLESRESLVNALLDYTGTVLMVAHDRFLLSEAADVVWKLEDGKLEFLSGSFDDYLQGLSADDQPQKPEPAPPREPASPRKKERQHSRKEQGDVRNRFYRELKPLKDEYAGLESQLDEVLVRQAELEALLADPETYAQPERLSELSRQYRESQSGGEALMERMAYLEKRIQDIESERDQLLGQ
jgi:ATP-binding cassette, subfamily F, member 3